METMLHSGMNEFIAAIYRQHQNASAAYMNAAYFESYKELAKLQAQHEQVQKEHLRRLENCEKIRELEKRRTTLDQNPIKSENGSDDMTNRKDTSALCRLCGATSENGTGWASKMDLADPIRNCLQIDVLKDKKFHPGHICRSCSDQLTRGMIQFTTMGTWPLLRIDLFDWSKKPGTVPGSSTREDCSLAQTLPAICTIAAKHGFLLVPEHTDERRVRFVRLTELGSNDVSASYILHLYRDLTWDLAIHGHSISNINLMRCGPLPRKVTHDCAELFFTAILALKLCPGITGLNPICRIISQNGPAVFHDNENKRLAVEDRFAKTVRHEECLLISEEGGQCDACNKYQPVAKQFQEQYLSITQLKKKSETTLSSLLPQSANKRRASEEESDADDVPTVKKAKMHDISLSNESSSRSAPRKKGESNSRSESFKLGSIGAHPASGLSLLAESASRLPLTADRPNMREQLLAKAVEKKQACGRCERCLRLDDCGQCDYCLDKPKFGGPNTKRRKCRLRTCVFYRQSQNGGRRRQQTNGRSMIDSASMVAAALGPNYLHQNFPSATAPIVPSQAETDELKIEKDSKPNANSESPTLVQNSDSVHTRRRPALQCHKCKHCASPDCANCRFCLDKPKFGGPGRLKQKCVERRCILERQQDAEIRKEKERKAANAILAKEATIPTPEPVVPEPDSEPEVPEVKPDQNIIQVAPTVDSEEELKVDEDEDIEIEVQI